MNDKINNRMSEILKGLCELSIVCGMDSNISFHLHQAAYFLNTTKAKRQYKAPVIMATTAKEFDFFVKEILISKPYPQNYNHQKGN